MTIDGRDIRELTRTIKDLIKVSTALNKTLVAIEQARVEEKTGLCLGCKNNSCSVGGLKIDDDCSCCRVSHVPSAIPG